MFQYVEEGAGRRGRRGEEGKRGRGEEGKRGRGRRDQGRNESGDKRK